MMKIKRNKVCVCVCVCVRARACDVTHSELKIILHGSEHQHCLMKKRNFSSTSNAVSLTN